MPRSTIEPTTADQKRPARYWFPLGFFQPTEFDAHELNAARNHQPTLNAIADHIEAISQELTIPLNGGILHAYRQSIGLVITCDPAHRALTCHLKATYHCQIAGVDETQDVLWLWRIDPSTQNRFAIMMADQLQSLG